MAKKIIISAGETVTEELVSETKGTATPLKYRSTKRLIVMITITVLAVCGVVGGVGYVAYRTRTKTIPSSVAKQLSFSPFVITDAKHYKTDSFKYDADNKGFSFVAQVIGDPNTSYTISQQETPDTFTDIPALFDKILGQLNSYDTVNTFNGALFVTRPKNAGQVAVLNEKGILMFIRSNHDVTSTQWKELAESMDILKLRH
jgi:hypothetical protein